MGCLKYILAQRYKNMNTEKVSAIIEVILTVVLISSFITIIYTINQLIKILG